MLAYNRHIVNNCTWCSRPRPSQRGGTAVALQPNQLARCCLIRGTVHSDVAAAGAVLQHSRALANWWGTCKRSTGVVPATTSSLNTAVCVVRHFCSWSVCVSMPSVSTLSWLTGQAATTRTIAITWLTSPHSVHLVPVYALMAAVFSYMSPSSAAACRVHYKHVVSFCQTALPPLFCSGFSRPSCASTDSRSNGHWRCSVAACHCCADHPVINRFSQSDHQI